MSVPVPNVDEIAKAMRLFVRPGGIGETRFFTGGGGPGAGFYFRHDEIERAARMAADEDPRNMGIYLVMNEINTSAVDCRSRLTVQYTLTKDEHVTRRRWILIDCDPKSPERGSDDSATDDEKLPSFELRERIFEFLRGLGFPEGVFADSGNGSHLLVAIDEPNDEPTKLLIQSLLNSLAKRFGTDRVGVDISVFNASRITKAYGSVARKGRDRPERPHRQSSIQSIPDGGAVVVSRELLELAVRELTVTAGTLLEGVPSTNGHDGNLNGFTLTKEKLILPPSFQEGSRHHNLLGIAGAARSIGSDRNEILDILRIFNRTRCASGKPDEELQKIAQDYSVKDVNLPMKAMIECSTDDQIEKAERHQQIKLALDYAARGLREGKDVDFVATCLSTKLGTLKASDDRPVEITAMSAAELDACEFEQNDLIADVMVEGQPCIVAAPKKCLKTNIMCDASLSLANADKFLNTFYVPKPKWVALLSGESGKKTIQETLRRIARTKQWSNLSDYENLFIGFDLPNFADDRSMKSLREFVRRHRIEVLIVDPAYLSIPLGDSAGNLFLVGQILQPFGRMAQDEGFTPVIVHHFIKASAVTEAPPEMESIAWAGFTEWMRQWILLSRRSRYDADNAGHHELWFVAGGSAGHSVAKAIDVDEGSRKDPGGRRWELTVKPIGEAIEESVEGREQVKERRVAIKDKRQREKDVMAVNKTLAANPCGLSFTGLRERSGVKYARLQMLMVEMVASGDVLSVPIMGGNKVEYPGYRLASVQPVQPVQKTDYTASSDGDEASVPLPGFPIGETGTGALSLPDVGDSHLKANGARKPRKARKASV